MTETETVTLAGVRTAVALLIRQQLAPDAPRGDVLGGQDPAEALAAMEAITTGLLAGVWPGDKARPCSGGSAWRSRTWRWPSSGGSAGDDPIA